ncbi:MAG: RNA 2',3'-cyclic phosphodiesterase [SAR202 cluster bacterium]|nr:RNA 2',3'-cyclic phosphodiesterase [SAR202 cluster bacterium]
MDATLRTFLAVDLPPGAKAALASLIARLKSAGLNSVRWVNLDTIHLTLKFMPETRPSDVERILTASKQALRSTQPFPLFLTRLGAFPNLRSPRVLWVGVEGDLPTLQHTQSTLESHVSPLGYPSDPRGFNPHITIGRLRDSIPPQSRSLIEPLIESEPSLGNLSWTAKELIYIHSTLTPQGPIYRTLGSIPLNLSS